MGLPGLPGNDGAPGESSNITDIAIVSNHYNVEHPNAVTNVEIMWRRSSDIFGE